MALCNCFETTSATRKHYQKSFHELRTTEIRGIFAFVFTWGTQPNYEEGFKDGRSNYFSRGLPCTLFPLPWTSFFACLSMVNRSVAHLTCFIIMSPTEASGANLLSYSTHTYHRIDGNNGEGCACPCQLCACVCEKPFESYRSVAVSLMVVTCRR